MCLNATALRRRTPNAQVFHLRHLSTMLSIERSIVPNTEFIRAEVFSLFLAIAVSAGALHATARSEGLLNFQVGYEAHERPKREGPMMDQAKTALIDTVPLPM